VISGNAARYLGLAQPGCNHWWRYALGTLVIVFFWLVPGYLPYIVLAGVGLLVPPLDYLAINFTIVMMLAGLWLAMRLHRRPLMSLITPERLPDWKRAMQGFAAWSVIAVATAVLEHALYPDRYYLSFNAGRFFAFAALVLLVTPVQTTIEELVFRGYVMQGLGLLIRRPVVVAAGSSLVFALPHLLNPEVQVHGTLIMAANYFAIGMLLATITLRDGRLELAIGVHAGNNLLLALVANYEGSPFNTESIFMARSLDPVYSLITLVIGSLLFYWLFFARKRRASDGA
jgi:CAAX protease family protein